jgi:hypothetical protein
MNETGAAAMNETEIRAALESCKTTGRAMILGRTLPDEAFEIVADAALGHRKVTVRKRLGFTLVPMLARRARQNLGWPIDVDSCLDLAALARSYASIGEVDNDLLAVFDALPADRGQALLAPMWTNAKFEIGLFAFRFAVAAHDLERAFKWLADWGISRDLPSHPRLAIIGWTIAAIDDPEPYLRPILAKLIQLGFDVRAPGPGTGRYELIRFIQYGIEPSPSEASPRPSRITYAALCDAASRGS